MQCSLPHLFRAGLLFVLLLSPDGLTAQEPQGAQSPAAAATQPPAVPELADLIPLAMALSGRLASLEKTIADGADLSRVEQQLGEISARVDEYARQFLALQASSDSRAGQLPQLKAEIDSAGDTLTGVSKSVTAKVRTFGNLRKEWVAEQQQWNAWQTALRKDEPLEEITTTVTKVQGTIDTALGLLLQQLKPLLVLQEQVGTLQTRITTLTAEVEGLLSLLQGGVVGDVSPPMFSAQHVSQVATALRAGIQTDLVLISWPGKAFFARQGWIMVLQGVLSLVLALVFLRHQRQLEQVEHWQFVAKRPIAGGLLAGVLFVAVFYERPPDIVRLAMNILGGIAFVRLVGGVVARGWRRQFVYGLLILSITINLCYVLGLPLALFRLYIHMAALVSLLCCLRWAAQSSRLREAWLYAWALRVAAVVFAAVLFTKLRGNAELAEFLFLSSLRTLVIVLSFGLLRHLVRGAWSGWCSAQRLAALPCFVAMPR